MLGSLCMVGEAVQGTGRAVATNATQMGDGTAAVISTQTLTLRGREGVGPSHRDCDARGWGPGAWSRAV